MQIKAAVTGISFFDSNSVNMPRNGIIMVFIPMFSLFLLCLRFC